MMFMRAKCNSHATVHSHPIPNTNACTSEESIIMDKTKEIDATMFYPILHVSRCGYQSMLQRVTGTWRSIVSILMKTKRWCYHNTYNVCKHARPAFPRCNIQKVTCCRLHVSSESVIIQCVSQYRHDEAKPMADGIKRSGSMKYCSVQPEIANFPWSNAVLVWSSRTEGLSGKPLKLSTNLNPIIIIAWTQTYPWRPQDPTKGLLLTMAQFVQGYGDKELVLV